MKSTINKKEFIFKSGDLVKAKEPEAKRLFIALVIDPVISPENFTGVIIYDERDADRTGQYYNNFKNKLYEPFTGAITLEN